MNFFNAKTAAILGAVIALPVITQGCSSDNPLGDVCCTDFKPGQQMLDVKFVDDVQVNGEFAAFAQASGDLSVVASAAINDVTGACKNIAVDLGADPADPATNGKTGANLMSFWCDKAVASINAAAGGSAKAALTIDFQPPECHASIQAQANCQAKCDVNAKCDIKANPPTCTGGKLEVACKGECTAKAGAKLSCQGKCTADCKGTCTAQGGVKCAGKCEGTCEGSGGAGTSGLDAQGNCNGTCKGTCSVVPPGVQCSGTCDGECSGSCQAEAGATVKCDGECKADYEPVSCTGGKLEGGCKVDAKCQGNCNASASAKADCSPPQLRIVATASASANIDKLIATLKTNLPTLLVVAQARGQAFVDTIGVVAEGGVNVSGKVAGNVKGTACLVAAGAAAVSAVGDFKAAFTASVNVVGSVKS